MTDVYPLVILGIGIVAIVGMITILRLNAFISLNTSAIIVSLLAAGPFPERISRVAEAFGGAAGKIGIVIALAVVIGKCMMDSGAADRIVRAFLRLLGEERVSIALMSSGFVLSIPVFFDTVFYLLVPLARSAYKRTGTHYVRYVVAITTGAIVTHSLVPPTPGPLVMAENLRIDLGMMILMGALVALPAGICGLIYGFWCDRRMNLTMRPLDGGQSEPEPLDESRLPALWLSVTPILLPVGLVSLNTIFSTLARDAAETELTARVAGITAIIGNVNLAMLLSAAIAMFTLRKQRHLNRHQMSRVVEISLMSGGMIGAWMNDSGFWVFAKMGGFTEGETLKSWTVLLVVTGFTGLLTTIILATILPLA